MGNFNLIGAFLSLTSFILTIISNLCISLKVIISLSILSILLIVKLIQVSLSKRKSNKELDALKEKHQNLKVQYTKTAKKLNQMNKYWDYLQQSYLAVINSSEEERFNNLYKLYLEYTNSIYFNKEDQL